MRRDLIEDARWRSGSGSGGSSTATLGGVPPARAAAIVDALFTALSEAHPEWCAIVELKFFLGLSDDEAAEALGMGLRTFQRQWQNARWWLYRRAEQELVQ